MGLYGAFDLHSKSSYLAIIDEQDKRIFSRRLPNDADMLLKVLEPYHEALVGIVVESTFNLYWLVDLLMEQGYQVHLANPSAIKQYEGLKYSDDKHDAFWLAHLLRLGILPEGYIYPRQDRPVRDLLRKRGHLMRLRTSLILSLQNMISSHCAMVLNVNRIKKTTEDLVVPLFEDHQEQKLSAQLSKESIDFLTRKIRQIEKVVEGKVKLTKPYRYLQTIPGVGKILSFTIMLETGPVNRFAKVGNYVSYCRKVPSQRRSNDKAKGKGNKKNGNKYLAWAFSEAAELARRYDQLARAYYNRKASMTNRMVAHSALAHKLARAAYYVMRDEVPFDHRKLFAF